MYFIMAGFSCHLFQLDSFDAILICSSNNALDKFVAKFLRKVLLRSASFISFDVSKSLVEVVECTSVSDESDDGVIGGTGENQLVTWVESIEDS